VVEGVRQMGVDGQAVGHLALQQAGVVVDLAAEVPYQEGLAGRAERVDLPPC